MSTKRRLVEMQTYSDDNQELLADDVPPPTKKIKIRPPSTGNWPMLTTSKLQHHKRKQTFNTTKKLLNNNTQDFNNFLQIYYTLNPLLTDYSLYNININIPNEIIILISEYSIGTIITCNLCELIPYKLKIPNEILILNQTTNVEWFETARINEYNIHPWLESIEEIDETMAQNALDEIVGYEYDSGSIICRECKIRFGHNCYQCDGCGVCMVDNRNTLAFCGNTAKLYCKECNDPCDYCEINDEITWSLRDCDSCQTQMCCECKKKACAAHAENIKQLEYIWECDKYICIRSTFCPEKHKKTCKQCKK